MLISLSQMSSEGIRRLSATSKAGHESDEAPPEDAEAYTEISVVAMTKYVVLFERSSTGYGAYVPDLPGCVATGRTLQDTRRRMAKAIEMHLAAMKQDGDEIPTPSHFELVEVA